MSEEKSETILVVHPVFTSVPTTQRDNAESAMGEACGLAEAIQLDVVETMQVNIRKISAGYLFGKGTRQNIADAVKEHEPDIVLINHALSPVQQRNLEKDLNAKIIDRTGIILEIFGARAHTNEGKIQVELASLEYQRSRLVRSWTHLERQRGGSGFMGGPGESQIELDRRMIADRIINLKKELLKVRKTRELGRKARERLPFPVVALVGYTNAGKSTLFNRLTGADVYVEDLLFATLDPTMRRIELPSGRIIILSDTVGFISDLPTHLVESFRATLEQTQYADAILHMRDSTQDNYKAHKKEVMRIMGNLGIEYESDERIFEVINKVDVCNETRREEVEHSAKFDEKTFGISAQTGEGVEELLLAIDDFLSRTWSTSLYKIPASDGKAAAWLYQHAEVLEREDEGEFTILTVHIDPANKDRFEGQFHYAAS